MKKKITISGRIVVPLKEGARAVISTGGTLIYTSPVVEILEKRSDVVRFETLNSVYRVCLNPVSVQAERPILRMCA